MRQLIVLTRGKTKYVSLYGDEYELIEPVEVKPEVVKPMTKSQAKRIAGLKKSK